MYIELRSVSRGSHILLGFCSEVTHPRDVVGKSDRSTTASTNLVQFLKRIHLNPQLNHA